MGKGIHDDFERVKSKESILLSIILFFVECVAKRTLNIDHE